jgi:hypothetical protein
VPTDIGTSEAGFAQDLIVAHQGGERYHTKGTSVPEAKQNGGVRFVPIPYEVFIDPTLTATEKLGLGAHGSGPEWFANPSLYDSLIRNSKPVYPGAIRFLILTQVVASGVYLALACFATIPSMERWIFKPAYKDGKPTRITMPVGVQVKFRLLNPRGLETESPPDD